jgi:aquaporin Z
MRRRILAAEFLGTFVLVFGGCGAAVLAGDRIGYLGIALAFGLTVIAMAYAVGHLSGAHLNPAITAGVAMSGRLPWRDVPGYVAAQVAGAVLASWVLYAIASGRAAGPDPVTAGFAANGYGAHSPGGFGLGASLLAEVTLSFLLVFTVLGATNPQAPVQFAGLAIGGVLALIHLVGIPVTNTSVNPARSTGPATVVGGWALAQLWLFWVAPLLGGLGAALAYRALEYPSAERLATRQRDEVLIERRKGTPGERAG